MEDISFFYLFLIKLFSSLFMRYCLEVITRILDCPLLVFHRGWSMHPISVFLCLSILICCPKAFNLPFPVGIPFSFVLLLNVVLLS